MRSVSRTVTRRDGALQSGALGGRTLGNGVLGDRALGDGGFTLIELMVALGLAAIISVSIMMISSQARLAYEETVKKVDVYNRFRYALQSIESDIKNWVPTGELEFFSDGAGRGAKLNSHWDPGEETPDRPDEYGAGLYDGGIYGEFDEFAFIESRQYRSEEPEQLEPGEKVHDAYRMYFQTITYVDGAMRLANVEYYLGDPRLTMSSSNRTLGFPVKVPKERVQDLVLVKVIRYYDVDPKLILKVNTVPVIRKQVEVATNVTDFRVEYTVEPKLRGRLRRKEVSFMTPQEDFEAPLEEAVRPKRLSRPTRYMKRFGYGSVKINEQFEKATAFAGIRGDRNIGFKPGFHQPVRFGFENNTRIQFSQLIPGDRMFVFTEGNRAGRVAGAGGASGGGAAQLIRFPSGDYTVKANRSGLVEFKEDIDSTEWSGQNQPGIYYKAPYLPSAVRITLRVVDDRGLNPKTLERIVWLRRRSR